MNTLEKFLLMTTFAPVLPAPSTQGALLAPSLRLDHLLRMTDSTGMFQHAIYSVPDFNHGYCTDDNARALSLTVMAGGLGQNAQMLERLRSIYLAFLFYALPSDGGRFRNFLSFDRRWLEPEGSEDSHGRALWALGTCLEHGLADAQGALARELFNRATADLPELTSLRAIAFCLLGLGSYSRFDIAEEKYCSVHRELAERLFRAFREHGQPEWPWCEPFLSYDNARLPQALIRSGRCLQRPDMIEEGVRALGWLMQQQLGQASHLRPPGCDWVFYRGGPWPDYDQQPVEVWADVSACLEAYGASDEICWWNWARDSFDWFLGRNDLGRPVYDSRTGGCRDGLQRDRMNQNQGAESTLAFLSALVEMRKNPGM